MTLQYRILSDEAMADSALSADEILALRHEAWSDGRIDAEEADAMFIQNDALKGTSDEWTDMFVESITTYLIKNSLPRGYISPAQADWLISKIDRDGRVDSLGELELLAKLFEQAASVPDSLKNYALVQIEQAVVTGQGPTRDGGSLDPGTISESECRLLRRFIFAAGGDRPAGVSKAEAEMLFRIKNSTLGQNNAASWKMLFVQGVGHYLQGFSCHEPLNQERAAELESFMNDTAVNIGGFFGRMAGKVTDGFSGIGRDDADYFDFDEKAAEAEDVTSAEQQWLQSQLDTDHQLDELEQALLDFIAEAA
jgi:hypothetical protein